MVHLTIDGQAVDVKEGTTVLEAAQQAGVEIPRLCHHPSLKPFGACRVCLVEVQGFRTLQPSCTLPASNNMVVQTNTPAVGEARKFVLSLIFSERNHFCPFCQMTGGDCELQNAALDQDMTHWPIQPTWKVFPVDASHPQILIDHNRCILCRRCVRVCSDLVGMSTLGFEERGSQSMLTADMGNPLGQSSCISCGACVQVCPTGTLVNRLAAYQGRDFTAEAKDSICLGCGIGCGITAMVRDNRLIRIDGDWQAEVNGGILCRAGRFDAMADPERITAPMARKDGKLQPVTLAEALDIIKARAASEPLDIALSPRVSLETINSARQIAQRAGGSLQYLPTCEVSPVPPFLGEHIESRIGKNDVLSKLPPNELTFVEPYAVHGGANSSWFKANGITSAGKISRAALVVAADGCEEMDIEGASFLAVISSYPSALTAKADVVLPCAKWSEQSGHYQNFTGQIQLASQLLKPAEGVLSVNETLERLAQEMGLEINQNWQAALQLAA